MPLMPKRVKFRKTQRGKIKGRATRGNSVAFGEYGLQSTEAGWIPANIIEACRIAITQRIRGEGKMWIRIFPHKSVTGTAAETRMGKGKGEPEFWAAVVRPGTMLFEISGLPEEIAKQAFARVARKLPLRCRMVQRRVGL